MATSLQEIQGQVEFHSTVEVARGLYWYCVHHHRGQSDPLYQMITQIGYEPSPLETGIDGDPIAEDVYYALERGDLLPDETLDHIWTCIMSFGR